MWKIICHRSRYFVISFEVFCAIVVIDFALLFTWSYEQYILALYLLLSNCLIAFSIMFVSYQYSLKEE